MLKYVLLGYVLLVVILEVLANHEIRPWDVFTARVPGGDKLGHFVVMGGLSLLINLMFSATRIRILGWKILAGSLIVLVLSTAVEASQTFIPARTFSLTDLLSDYLGIFGFGRLAAWLSDRGHGIGTSASSTAHGVAVAVPGEDRRAEKHAHQNPKCK